MKRILISVRRNMAPILAITALTVLFAACKKDNDLENNTPVAGLMAFNLSPDKTPIGIALGGSNLTNVPLNYTSYTGAYVPIFPGTRLVDAIDPATGSSFASTSQNFEVNKYYSVFTIGANGKYSNLVVEDELDSLSSTSGEAFVRYINAIPDSSSPAVTITSGANVINGSAAYGSVSAFNKVAPGNITLSVANESDISANRTFAVEKDKVYTVLLVGLPGNTDTTKAVQIKYITNGTITP